MSLRVTRHRLTLPLAHRLGMWQVRLQRRYASMACHRMHSTYHVSADVHYMPSHALHAQCISQGSLPTPRQSGDTHLPMCTCTCTCGGSCLPLLSSALFLSRGLPTVVVCLSSLFLSLALSTQRLVPFLSLSSHGLELLLCTLIHQSIDQVVSSRSCACSLIDQSID